MDNKRPVPNAKSQIMYDPMIISRVKQYLEENVHQTYVDVGVMAKLLQERYREYSRRKAAPFRQLVEQAYKTVLRSYGLDSNPSSDDNDDISSDLEMMEDRPDLMNNMMTKMYMDKQGSGSGPPSNNNELIDISSDESDSENSPKKPKSKTPVLPSQITIEKVVIPEAKKHGSVLYSTGAKPKMFESNAPLGQVVASFSRDPKRRKINENDDPPPSVVPANKADNLTKEESLVQPAKIVKRRGVVEGSTSIVSNLKPNNKKAKHEFAVQTSNLNFKHVGGIDRILNELWDLLTHIKNHKVYSTIGLPPPRGFLLHGPPGCGKTLLAQAIAGQLGIELIEVAATELVSGVSGESEERIRELFEQAASSAPCVLFIDEIDAISSNRQNAQKEMERRIVSQLLISLDGLSKHPNGNQVLIIGATSRPDSLDPALRRVGRFDQEISLGIPDRSARQKILQVICADLLLSHPFDYDAIAALTPGYVGADLLALTIRAASLAVTRALRTKEEQNRKLLEIQTVNLIEESLEGLDFLNEPTIKKPAIEMATIDLDDDVNTGDASAVATTKTPQILSKGPAVNGSTEIVEKKEETKNGTLETIEKKEETNNETTVPMVIEDDDVTPVEEKKEDNQIHTDKSTMEKQTGDTESKTSATTQLAAENNEVEESPTVNTETVKSSEKNPEEKVDEFKDKAAEPDIDVITEKAAISDIDALPEKAAALDTDAVQEKDVLNKSVDSDIEMTPIENTEISKTANVSEKANADTQEIVDLSDDEHCDTLCKRSPNQDDIARWLQNHNTVLDDEDLQQICITMNDFTDAVKLIQPSAKREGFITVPDITWDDIGSLRDIREELQLAVLAPVKFPHIMQQLGLQSPSGVLLCGPPGCGKTLLAKAVANEAGVNFISVKGPELLNMYVGESERAVRQCFQRARNSAPCVIFFDEFDALCPTRSGSSENTSSSRVVNQLLTEMDGVEDRKGVFLLAATNRPDIVDPAVLRPGRLDKILYVGLPGIHDRAEILRATTKKTPLLDTDVDIEELATLTDNYTGADLTGLVRQASVHALKKFIDSPKAFEKDSIYRVNRGDFLKALKHIRPSVSEEDKKHYAKLQKKYMVNESTPK